MRMWLVDPFLLCRRHLLGEHVELHMLVGTLRRGISIQGYLDNGLVDTSWIWLRHDELVAEMENRGMNHTSPLAHVKVEPAGCVDLEANLKELAKRCHRCRERIELYAGP